MAPRSEGGGVGVWRWTFCLTRLVGLGVSVVEHCAGIWDRDFWALGWSSIGLGDTL